MIAQRRRDQKQRARSFRPRGVAENRVNFGFDLCCGKRRHPCHLHL